MYGTVYINGFLDLLIICHFVFGNKFTTKSVQSTIKENSSFHTRTDKHIPNSDTMGTLPHWQYKSNNKAEIRRRNEILLLNYMKNFFHYNLSSSIYHYKLLETHAHALFHAFFLQFLFFAYIFQLSSCSNTEIIPPLLILPLLSTISQCSERQTELDSFSFWTNKSNENSLNWLEVIGCDVHRPFRFYYPMTP